MKPAVSVHLSTLVFVNYTPQGITLHCRNWGQEGLLIVATVWCLFLFQWMAKLWPEGAFMKVGRLVFTAILRTKCNLTRNGVSSRILMELSESDSLFSLPAAHSAVLTGAGNPLSSLCFFLSSAQLSSHQLLTVMPLKGKNCSAFSIACFI